MQKSKLWLLGSSATFALTVTLLVACHKNSPATSGTDTGFSSEQAIADKSFEDAQTASDAAASTPSGGSANFRTMGTGCAIVSRTPVDTGTYAGDTALTINFGTGCTGIDGRTRSGEIIVYYSGAYAATGSTHTITFNNYFMDGNQVLGTKTVTNMGTNGSGQIYFNVTVNGSVIRANGAGTVSITGNRVRTWIQQSSAGSANIYSVYTSSVNTLTRANGTQVQMNVSASTPLIYASDCKWIEAGTIDYTLPSTLTATMDYGANSGTYTCHQTATLTYNGHTYTITLP